MYTRGATDQGEVGVTDMVVGQEVDRLYQWMRTQRAAIGPIAEIEPLMRTLQQNGVLDGDFRVADEAQLDALLADVARMGRVDAYRSDGPAISADVLEATRAVAERDGDARNQIALAHALKGEEARRTRGVHP